MNHRGSGSGRGRGRGRNPRGRGGGGYGYSRRTGPGPSSESSPPPPPPQPIHQVFNISICLNNDPSPTVPACSGSEDGSSRTASSLPDQTSEFPSSPIGYSPIQQSGSLLPSGSKDKPFNTEGSQFDQTSKFLINRGRGRSLHGGGGYGYSRGTGPSPTFGSPLSQPNFQQQQDRTSEFLSSPIVDSLVPQACPLLPVNSGSQDRLSKNTGPQCGQTSSDSVATDGNSENSEPSLLFKAFDICLMKKASAVTLKAPLFTKNRERRKEDLCLKNGPQQCLLRPGMVLLKNYLGRSDQIKIVKICKDLGVGQGGFQQPGYKDGAKLQLMMMCLGKHWDPETGLYGDKRPTDGHVPPGIPAELTMLVKGAIQASHALIKQKKKEKDPQHSFPSMQPDICIVNFYTNSGKLGLHQDKDETKESLDKGLPVVSFSIGDSAKFLYGDHRDAEKAEEVSLESGDVLIFGGMSRHIFHGVEFIETGTAPKTLLDDTNLRPGRLNLTFRKY